MRTHRKFFKKRTSPDSFRRLRSLPPDDPEWRSLRDQIFEENMGLAYYAVERASRWLLNTFNHAIRDQTREELLQLAFIELNRVVTAYNPDWPNPRRPSKPVEFATFALSNLLPKVKVHCRKEIDYYGEHTVPVAIDDDENGDDPLANVPAEPSTEEITREREERITSYLSRSDPVLAGRLRSILDKLWGGYGATIFERQLLFKLIADPGVILTRVKHDDAAHDMSSEFFEPLPLRRHRWWRQMLD